MSYARISGLLGSLIILLLGDAANADSLDEVVVTASLRGTTLAQLPTSVTVLDQDFLRGAGVQHLEDVLGAIPDLNWAAGTSRPRFFQLRGIGEVEQYQGAPNPSVGFLIDDIDFSGVGMPATLFDTEQVEVLRGPQGTILGANALAGLINVRTVEPGRQFELKTELTGAAYGTRSLGLAVGDGLGVGDGGWRLVAQRYLSDGFRHNAFLNRSDTNGYDETTLRGKIHWNLASDLKIDLSAMRVNLANGYDAWSINNSYTTYSNQPGLDRQRASGIALKVTGPMAGSGTWSSVTSVAESFIINSFDGDWGNDVLWGSNAPYDYFQEDHRTRRTVAQDLQWKSTPGAWLGGRSDWLAGIYALRLTESDDLQYLYDTQYNDPGSSQLHSDYQATNVALYGSTQTALSPIDSLTVGLRLENRVANYADTADAATPFPSQINRMWGGNLSWTRALSAHTHAYTTLSRGYKGGGFNIGSGILSEQRSFAPESLWSLEAGLKRSDAGRWDWQSDIFYMRRQNMQVYLSEQLQQNNPLAYVFFTQNASQGENYGLESQLHYALSSRWQLSGSASLLCTRYLGVTGLFAALGLDGRAQPFAPGYKLAAAVEYHHPSGWFGRLDSSALDSFYYYTSDAQTSKAYHLENLRVGFEHGPVSTSLWVRNVFQTRYAQQGFYFGLIPPNFPNQSFLQLGDPRQLGFTIRYEFGGRHE